MNNMVKKYMAVLVGLALTATGLQAAGAAEEGSAAADRSYVTDPTTGKVVVAPEYGGTFTHAYCCSPPDFDSLYGHGGGRRAGFAGVVEKLGWVDWAMDRNLYSWSELVPDSVMRGHLAESWETPDPRTYIFHIRQGVHWHNRPPVNGRELTAKVSC